MEDIVKIHAGHMHDELKHVILSLDGVSETKSTTTNLDVYSLKFRGCRDVYPVKIIRQINKYKIDLQTEFGNVLDRISEQNLEIDFIVADNPKRAFLRNSLQAGGKLCCEYCFQSGVSFCSHGYEETKTFSQEISRQKKN